MRSWDGHRHFCHGSQTAMNYNHSVFMRSHYQGMQAAHLHETQHHLSAFLVHQNRGLQLAPAHFVDDCWPLSDRSASRVVGGAPPAQLGTEQEDHEMCAILADDCRQLVLSTAGLGVLVDVSCNAPGLILWHVVSETIRLALHGFLLTCKLSVLITSDGNKPQRGPASHSWQMPCTSTA